MAFFLKKFLTSLLFPFLHSFMLINCLEVSCASDLSSTSDSEKQKIASNMVACYPRDLSAKVSGADGSSSSNGGFANASSGLVGPTALIIPTQYTLSQVKEYMQRFLQCPSVPRSPVQYQIDIEMWQKLFGVIKSDSAPASRLLLLLPAPSGLSQSSSAFRSPTQQFIDLSPCQDGVHRIVARDTHDSSSSSALSIDTLSSSFGAESSLALRTTNPVVSEGVSPATRPGPPTRPAPPRPSNPVLTPTPSPVPPAPPDSIPEPGPAPAHSPTFYPTPAHVPPTRTASVNGSSSSSGRNGASQQSPALHVAAPIALLAISVVAVWQGYEFATDKEKRARWARAVASARKNMAKGLSDAQQWLQRKSIEFKKEMNRRADQLEHWANSCNEPVSPTSANV